MSLHDAIRHQVRHGFVPYGVTVGPELPVQAPKKLRGSRQPNKTENEFGRILEARKQKSEIYSYCYEGLTIRWGDGMRYTPDWVAFQFPSSSHGITVFEIKGGHIFSRDIVRFKGCKAEWRDRLDFEMWQKKAGNWNRIL